MTYNNYLSTDHYGTLRQVITSIDRFEAVDNFLDNIKQYCQNAKQDDNSIIITKNGDVWMNNRDQIMKQHRIAINHIIDDIRCVNHILDIKSTKSLMSREHFRNHTFCDHYQNLINKIGATDLYPDFFGIEIAFIASNHFAMAYSLVTIKGPDSDTFHNAMAIIND